uniref:Acetylglutamate kinase n=1 Tax=Arundo donax TaxID=35708 RepID=A0A0A9GTE2_ARUDO
MMLAVCTPCARARTQHSTFGIIPPATFPSATICRTPAISISFTRLPGSFRSANIPDTSVSSSSFSAPTAAAISPAAVSALML